MSEYEIENGGKLNKDTVILLASTLIIALCGLLYELLIGATSTYLLGSSLKQYAFTIGAFMTSFGVGSYLSKYVKKNMVFAFFIVETIIGFLGSISILSLHYFYSVSDIYGVVTYFFIISIGGLVGLEIPLIGRMIEEIRHNLRITLANLFSFDYIGAMIGSVALPLYLYPRLGLVRSSILVGISNLFVSLLVGYRFRRFLKKAWLLLPLLLIALDGIFFLQAESVENYLEQKFYEDKIIFQMRSKYQKIVVTEDGDDIRLFLDGNIQFSASDEYRYHEGLVHIPMIVLPEKESYHVLVLGGGDGLAARELLKYPQVKQITICDLDPAITEIARKEAVFKKINQDSLNNPKVKVVNQDAFVFLDQQKKIRSTHRGLPGWDLIIIDLPDPNNEGLAKLYGVKFYQLVKANLAAAGVAVAQATSPYHARKVFWCIYHTLKAAGFEGVLPYHVNVPAFGLWGFQLFARHELKRPEKLRIAEKQLRFLSSELLSGLFTFAKDIQEVPTEVNKVFKPVILDYYEESWKTFD